MTEKTFTITAEAGLHARPATVLVHAASQYKSEIQLQYKEKSVNLKSIMGVMSLGIKEGSQITVKTEGEDELEAISKIEEVMKKEGLGK
ncbi:MAG: phosphocarrier protein HPr [Anaerobacillus sp.]|uniref:phosphocarrier protein HPr n=1 Tax=Anaerobacillus sp. TaxID=1872506 RepID=UPI00391ADD47